MNRMLASFSALFLCVVSSAVSAQSFRVRTDPFQLTVRETSLPLTKPELDLLLAYTEEVIGKEIRNDVKSEVRFVVISTVEATLEGTTSIVSFGEGVVKFDGNENISQEQVADYIQAATSSQLLYSLVGDETSLDYLSSIDYGVVLGEGNDSGSPSAPSDSKNRGQEDSSSSGPSTASIIVIMVSLGVVIVAFIVMAVLNFNSRRRRQQLEIQEALGLEKPPRDLELEGGQFSVDDACDEDEDSDRTREYSLDMSSEKEIDLRQTNPLDKVPSAVSQESFLNQRCVNIQKDMLTSTWSGSLPSNQRPIMETVLEPSHFSASEERRQQSLS